MTRIGVIGAGAWGMNHVRTFAGLAECNLAAVSDNRPKVLEGLQRSHPSLRVYADGTELVRSEDIDAVVIATPSPAHAPLAKAALEAGKHVLVEKPMALSVADAEACVKLAARNGKVLMVGHLLLYHSAVMYLRQLIDSGELGDPRYVYCERVNLGTIRKDENALWSFAPHDLSVAAFLLGTDVADVSARGAAYLQPGVHDVVFTNIRYRDGRMANIHVSWLDPHKSRRIVLVGSKKMAVFDDMAAEKIRVYDKGADKVPAAVGYEEHLTVRSGDILIPHIKLEEPLKVEAKHFLACIRDEKTPRSDGANGLLVVKLLEAAQRSLDQGGLPVQFSSLEVHS
jgi:predicted dehydrogenase